MPISLHSAFIPSALQMLGTCDHLVAKAQEWCEMDGCSAADLLDSRIHAEMLPFAYQIKSVGEHTAGAIKGVRKGVFGPDLTPPPADFAGLSAKIAAARETLTGVTESEMEGFVGQPMRFEFRDFGLDFAAEDFLLSFSQPNYYFHAATAYDILRMTGVGVGKRDFMGALRIRTA